MAASFRRAAFPTDHEELTMPRQKGYVPTDTQVAGLAKGKETQRRKAAEAKAAGAYKAKERWAMLLSGTLLVSELDDQEIKRMRVRSRDGSFSGRARPIPSHLAQRFHQEALKRAQDKFRTAAPDAVEGLLKLSEDPDVPAAVRFQALKFVAERALGKTPEVVRIEGQSEFDRVSAEAVGLVRDLADDVGDTLDPDGPT